MPNAISAAALVPGWLGARVRSASASCRVSLSCSSSSRPDMRVSEEKFPPARCRDCGGHGRGHEVHDNFDEPLGVFAVGVVPDAFEDLESAPGGRAPMVGVRPRRVTARWCALPRTRHTSLALWR